MTPSARVAPKALRRLLDEWPPLTAAQTRHIRDLIHGGEAVGDRARFEPVPQPPIFPLHTGRA